MFATCRCTVCSLSTSEPAISRFESPDATSRSTSVSRDVSGESPFSVDRRRVVEEAGERAMQLALVVEPRQVRVAAERDEARVRKQRRELAAARDRHGAVAAAMQHERGSLDLRQHVAQVRAQVELEERGGDVGVRRAALVRAEPRDLVTARVRREQPASICAASGQFVRTKSTSERRVASGMSSRAA